MLYIYELLFSRQSFEKSDLSTASTFPAGTAKILNNTVIFKQN